MNTVKEQGELGLIVGILMTTKNIKEGRLKNLLKKAEKRALTLLDRKNKSESDDIISCGNIRKFEAGIGWNKTPKHIMTYISFLAYLSEGIDDKLNDIFQDVAVYFTRGTQAGYITCMDAGKRAYMAWNKIWEN